MIEHVRWSRRALDTISSLTSPRFSADETAEYRRRLLQTVENKIMLLGTSMPSRDEQYHGTYFVLVDGYKIYYKLSDDGKLAFVQTARHTHMQ